MTDTKTIAVMGATGAQGGSLVRAILNEPQSGFRARAITRDRKSDKAKELESLGAEIVEADLEKPESVKQAFEGSYGAYCVTFYWAHMSPETELRQARIMADAAKQAHIKHAIWSTLEDTRKWVPLNDDRMPTLMGKYKVPHFDAKGEADKFFIDAGVPTTFLYPSFYWENFVYFGSGPKRGPDGKLTLTFPLGSKKLGGIAAEDIGKCAFGIFKRGQEYIGKRVGIASDHLKMTDIAEAMSRYFGEQVVYNDVEPSVFRSFGFPGADDLGNMFQFYRDFEDDVNTLRDPGVSRELNPELLSFNEWLARNHSKIPIT